MSDLHCEFEILDIPIPGCQPGGEVSSPTREDIDGVLLAGDISTRGNYVDAMLLIWDVWRCPVVMVKGNHDFYGKNRIQKQKRIDDERIDMMRSAGADIQILDRQSMVIGDTRIIGATLWTDTEVWPEFRDNARFHVEKRMSDYKSISIYDERKSVYRKLRIGDTMEMHRKDKGFILNEVAQPFDGKTLVMTHHVPVVEALSDEDFFERDRDTAGYASDLWSEISGLGIDAWLSGHVHVGRSIYLNGDHGKTSFISNMRGYPNEEGINFDPLHVIDSSDFSIGLEEGVRKLEPSLASSALDGPEI